MKVRSHSANQERSLLIAMIVNRSVLAAIAAHWTKEGLFSDRWSNIVAKWCVHHFQKFKQPPKSSIEGIYDEWTATKEGKDKETVALVGKFISSLSSQYVRYKKEINPDFTLDLAAKYFNRVRLKKLSQQIEGELQDGKPEKAEELIRSFRRVEVGRGSGINILTDEAAMIAAFEERGESIISHKGALGNFFGDAFERDSFVCFMGKEKVGKTWWLIDTAWRAMLQQRRTAFFEVGDMSQNQLMRRFLVRAAKRPWRASTVRIPTFLNPGKPPTVQIEEKTFLGDLEPKKGLRAFKKIDDKLGGNSYLRMSIHPNNSMTAGGIHSICENWSREGWTPDVVVIDYADLLAPMNGTAETRDQINMTWKTLRSMSQSFHCCLVTATQADAASYTANTLRMGNFSEDKRKLAHCTAMVGLNQQPDEKEFGLMRLNWVVLREGEFTEDKCVFVAGCLGLGNPAVYSVF